VTSRPVSRGVMHPRDKRMKTIAAILIAFPLLVPWGAEAETLSPSVPANYVLALQTADSFLWAWVNRDADTGRPLISHHLSSRIQKGNQEEWFRTYMIGLSNPHHHSFEIGPGKKINSKRWSFPVTLYEHYTGEPKAFKYESKIEVIQDGNAWRVDVLPITADAEE
jgi:hypothetical protein